MDLRFRIEHGELNKGQGGYFTRDYGTKLKTRPMAECHVRDRKERRKGEEKQENKLIVIQFQEKGSKWTE